MLGQEAVAGKSGEAAAVPALPARLAEGGGLDGALPSADAIACNAKAAGAFRAAGADYLLAFKAYQPTLRAAVEALFEDALPERVGAPSTSTGGTAGSRSARSASAAR